MDSDLRMVIREYMEVTRTSIEEMDAAWVAGVVAQDPEARKIAYKVSTYRQGFVDGLQWVLDLLDTRSMQLARPLSAGDRIEAYLTEHPEDGVLSVRALASRVGVSKSAVDKWRKLSLVSTEREWR